MYSWAPSAMPMKARSSKNGQPSGSLKCRRAEWEEEEGQDQHEGQVRRAVGVDLGLAEVGGVEVEQA